MPTIARCNTLPGTEFGVYRRVAKQSLAWLHGFRRLRVRWKRRADAYKAFLKLASRIITHRQLQSLRQPF